MKREVRRERMFPDELDASLVACPVVYFPYGLYELRGPHWAMAGGAVARFCTVASGKLRLARERADTCLKVNDELPIGISFPRLRGTLDRSPC